MSPSLSVIIDPVGAVFLADDLSNAVRILAIDVPVSVIIDPIGAILIAAPREHSRTAGGTAVVVILGSTDYQVGEAITVDVAGPAHGLAEEISGRISIDRKEDRPVHAGTHACATGIVAVVVVQTSPDDEVGEAITVDVAGPAH
jgi:hypothetical protein